MQFVVVQAFSHDPFLLEAQPLAGRLSLTCSARNVSFRNVMSANSNNERHTNKDAHNPLTTEVTQVPMPVAFEAKHLSPNLQQIVAKNFSTR